MGSDAPLVSIIIATYNRSNVLCYTISSVLRAAFSNWEVIVVGDACTDDTEAVVASFKDKRIRFFNLKENFGDQAGPNNEGLRHASGRYIAYLNHDDLWRESHIDMALQGIEATGADLVCTLGIAVSSDEIPSLLQGFVNGTKYFPSTFIPASLWFARRELVEDIGPWKHPNQCYVTPSQDFLLRAWRKKKKIISIPKVTVIAIQAGFRPNVYSERHFLENKIYFERMSNEDDFWEKEILKAGMHSANELKGLSVLRPFRRGFVNILKRFAIKFGISPVELASILRFRRKGALINQWRENIGLSRL